MRTRLIPKHHKGELFGVGRVSLWQEPSSYNLEGGSHCDTKGQYTAVGVPVQRHARGLEPLCVGHLSELHC